MLGQKRRKNNISKTDYTSRGTDDKERRKDIETGYSNTDETGHSKTTKDIYTSQKGENARRQINNPMTRKQNNF